MVLCWKNLHIRVVLRNNIHFKSNSHTTIRHIQNEISTPRDLQSTSFLCVLMRRRNIDEPRRNSINIRWYSTARKNNYLKEDGTFEAMTPIKMDPIEDKRNQRTQSTGNYQKNMLNEKRLARTQKRQAREILRMKEDEELSDNYHRQRTTIVENFSNPTHISGLFKSKPKAIWENVSHKNNEKSASNYKDLVNILNNGSGFRYYTSEIQNTLNLISTYFVNSILVEINIRKIFADKNLNKYPDSFLYRNSLMNNIKDEKKKNEILKILVQLYDRKENDDPQSFDHFFESLNRNVIEELMGKEILESDYFNSVEFYRHNFNVFKSSQYLNYDHSDTLRFIQSSQPVKFKSPEQNNEEYYAKLEHIFKAYDRNDPLGHLSLIASVSKVLMTCQEYTPTISIFNYLLQKLGQIGLYNYQSIVYDNLPSFRYKQSLLATPEHNLLKAPKVAYQLQDIIEDDPNFLTSFIDYQVVRDESGFFKELLSFYRLEEIAAHEKVLMKSNLKSLVSKSRFSSFRSHIPQSISFNCEDALFTSVDSIYSTISACIDLKQFEFIDLLVSKLILHSVTINDKVKVALTFGKQNDIKTTEYSLLIAEELSTYDLSCKIFTKELFILLLRACRESDDVGRLMWLTPHLDLYLSTNLEQSKDHLETIKQYFNDLIIHQAADMPDIKTFIGQDSEALIDSKLISSIHETFSLFGIDGKVLKYNEVLDFKNTVADQVCLTRQKIDNERENIKKHGGKVNLNHYLDDLYFYLNPAGAYGEDPTKKTYKR